MLHIIHFIITVSGCVTGDNTRFDRRKRYAEYQPRKITGFRVGASEN